MNFLKLLYKKFFSDEIPALAAQLTYYLLLSFFPFLIFLLALLSYTPFSISEILNDFAHLLPQTTYSFLKEIINTTSNTKNDTLLSFSMLATVWAASNGISAVIRGINKSYNKKETRPFWKVKWTSIIFTLALGLIFIISLVMLVLGKMLWDFSFDFFELPASFRTGWDIIRHIIPLFSIFIVLSAVYLYIPAYRLTFREAAPGAIFSSIGFMAISLIFSFYVNKFGSLANAYGTIGSVIAFLIWIYWNSMVIMLGSEINAILNLMQNHRINPK
jgi:membrane protein